MSLKHVHLFRDRHGKRRAYLRLPGKSAVPLLLPVGSPQFMAAYNAAVSSIVVEPAKIGKPTVAGSVSATIAAYYTDQAFLTLAPGTRKMRRAILERFRVAKGDKPLAGLEQKNIALTLGQMKPFAARNWLKTLRGLMQFAVGIGLRLDDPTENIRLAKAKLKGFTPWSEAEIARYRKQHALGTRERLALELLAATGAARVDVVRLGPQHVVDGWISYRRQKTGVAIEVPVLPELQEAINETPAQGLAFLLTTRGAPFTAPGFGNWFRACCDAAGVSLSAHGVRKYAATNHANHGATAHELMAWFGWLTMREAAEYTRNAERRTLTLRAARRLATGTRIRKPQTLARKP